MGSHTIARPDRETQIALDGLRRVVHLLRVSAHAAEHRSGLSGAQLFVLQQLGEGPAGSLEEIAQRTLTHQSSVSVVASRLVERGLVAREKSASDGRRVELRLTAAGRRLLRRAPATAQGRLITALAGLRARERRNLAGGLSALVAALGIGEGPPQLFFETAVKGRGHARA
jgi:DNA-binding MarR family transcriptional regulator